MAKEGKEWLRDSLKGGGVEICVRLTPRASRDAVEGVKEGELRVRLTSPPVDDAANEHLVRFLARLLGVPRSAIRIISGAKSRTKRVSVEGCTREQALAVLKDAPQAYGRRRP